jgi:head-tail adaptor
MSNRRAGALRERLSFQQRGDSDDGWGNVQPGAGDWETQFTISAALKPRVGSESVDAARLQGRQPYVCTVRYSKAMSKVTTAWQIVDARDASRVLAVVSPFADPDGRNRWMEALVMDGAPS